MQPHDPQGRLVYPRSEATTREVFETTGQKEFPIHFAHNDPKGKYSLTLTDVNTGLSSRAEVTLE